MARAECAYCENQNIKDHFGPQWTEGTTYDALLDDLILTASRLIDNELHWPDCHFAAGDLADQTRYFDSEAGLELWIPRAISITSLGVDQDADGVYEEAWVQGTDYEVWPYDLASFDKIIVKEGTTRSFPTGQRRVQIVGKFGGYTTPPQKIKQACIITASRWFKRGLQQFQDTGAIIELGELVYTKSLDPDVVEILRIEGRRLGIG